MDQLLADIVQKLSAAADLEEVSLPAELGRTRYPLGALDLVCRNWRSGQVEKLYCMRMKVKIPKLDILGMAFYPKPDLDIPLFMFDLSVTKKKIISYINVLAVSADADYRAKYMAPFEKIRERYADFHPFKMPEWMEAYRSGATIYADPETSRLPELQACVREYFSEYLKMLTAAEAVTDHGRLAEIKGFYDRFKSDLITKDRSQIMLGKVIGKQKAGRIFREVLI